MSALDIVKNEPIRYIDGRWSDGFVDQAELDHLVKATIAEKYMNGGMSFVRLAIPFRVEEQGDEA